MIKHSLLFLGILLLALPVALAETIPFALNEMTIQISKWTPGYAADPSNEPAESNFAQYKICAQIFAKPIRLSDSAKIEGDGQGVLLLLRKLFRAYADENVHALADCYTPDAAKAINEVIADPTAVLSLKKEIGKYSDPELECIISHVDSLLAAVSYSDGTDRPKRSLFLVKKVDNDFRISAEELREKRYLNLIAFLTVHPATDLLQPPQPAAPAQ